MKKKLTILFNMLLIFFALIGCESGEKLYLLNVGDYIDETILSDFEEYYLDKYNKKIEVVLTEVNSNEEIYQKLKNERYDICFVSDYMIDRMYQENMLKEIDMVKVGLTSDNNDRSFLLDSALELIDNECGSYKNYFLPYFWGTVGILYSTRENDRYTTSEIEEDINTKGLSIMFENNIYNKGMYNSSRDAICMSLLANGININTDIEEDIRKYGMLPIKNTTYRAWGDDNLKTMISNGELDLALVYSGDYLDELYQCEMDNDEIYFNYIAPKDTNIWIDGICILENAKNVLNAYEFLNYFFIPEVQAQNADSVGYCPLVEEVFDIIWNGEDYMYSESYTEEMFIPYDLTRTDDHRVMYKYVSDWHYNLLNDLLDEAKSK